jgi:hypothetical protein
LRGTRLGFDLPRMGVRMIFEHYILFLDTVPPGPGHFISRRLPMSEEPKKDDQIAAAQNAELSSGELDNVAGGLAIKSDPDEGGDYTGPEKLVVEKTKAVFPR